MKSLVQGPSSLCTREALSTRNIAIPARNGKKFRKLASPRGIPQNNLPGRAVTEHTTSEAQLLIPQAAVRWRDEPQKTGMTFSLTSQSPWAPPPSVGQPAVKWTLCEALPDSVLMLQLPRSSLSSAVASEIGGSDNRDGKDMRLSGWSPGPDFRSQFHPLDEEG